MNAANSWSPASISPPAIGVAVRCAEVRVPGDVLVRQRLLGEEQAHRLERLEHAHGLVEVHRQRPGLGAHVVVDDEVDVGPERFAELQEAAPPRPGRTRPSTGREM